MQDRRPRNKPPRLAVTGGIGSGKSTALAFLGELGAATLSSDALVHEAMERDEIIQAIAGRVPAAVTGGHVDRSTLARTVFRDDDARIWLEGLLHPEVRRGVQEWAAAQADAPSRPDLLAVEVPLLFESAMMLDLFDAVLCVTAPADVRRRRVAVKMTRDEFQRRAAQQMDEDDKAARSDYVIENTGSAVHLCENLADVYADILAGGPRRNGASNGQGSGGEGAGRL